VGLTDLAATLLLALPLGAEQLYLTDRDTRIIRENWADYAYAAKRVGIPVAILPTLHYRESSLRRTQNLGGPFMLDLGPLNDGAEFTRRIRAYERRVAKLYGYPEGTRVSDNFRFACVVAAHELLSKSKCGRALQGHCLVDAFWGYNGRASWHRDPEGNRSHLGSAYVWSDPKRGHVMKKKFRNRAGEFVEYPDTRPGVMVIYLEVADLSVGG